MLEILLVEDNPEDAELALRAIKSANIANPVVHAHDGPEALALLNDRAAVGRRFGLVLLDLHLPGISGMALLEHIKNDEFLRSTSVVVLTGQRDDPIITRCYALGANAYAVKPIRFDSYHAVVQQLHLSWVMVTPNEDIESV